jgi:2-dehydro-3-deoxygalactonokinase
MSALPHTALMGIDWGLTQLRAYLIGEAGEILEQRQSASGILSILDKAFAKPLRDLIEDWLEASPHLPIYLCGMIGSRNGWVEAPYSACPATLGEVAERALAIDVDGRRALLMGGLSFTDTKSRRDVIRGEETQIFGALGDSGSQLVIAPGTHSKWARVCAERVEHFRTYMTGELYAVLRHHSSIGWWTQAVGTSEEDERSFLEGVQASLDDADVLHSLFTVRTRALFNDLPPAAHAAYLSGILIGNEVAGALRLHRHETITLIGSSSLSRLYRTALSAAGAGKVECIAGDRAVARGLWRMWQWRASR